MPTIDIDHSCHIKAIYLFVQSYGVYITPLVINSLGGGHIHAYRHSWTEAILRNQARVCGWCAPGLKRSGHARLQYFSFNHKATFIELFWFLANTLSPELKFFNLAFWSYCWFLLCCLCMICLDKFGRTGYRIVRNFGGKKFDKLHYQDYWQKNFGELKSMCNFRYVFQCNRSIVRCTERRLHVQ